MAGLSDEEKEKLLYAWPFWARPNQLAPKWDWSVWLLKAGRGQGKGLSLETEVPLHGGSWTTMGDLRVGDSLLDDRGKRTTVTFATDVQLENPCFEITFSDGTKVIADDEHQWATRNASDKPFNVTNTAKLFKHGGRHFVDDRFIQCIKPVPSVPCRCIQVDSPSSLFLITRFFIPTHNTRSGAEQVREWAKNHERIALIGRTPADVRDVMVAGESGIIAVSPRDEKPRYESTKRRIVWPNGAMGFIYSAYEPDDLRGPQHEKAWFDELASMQYVKDTWDNAMMGLRLGRNPQAVVTTTPRPIPIIRELLANAKGPNPTVSLTEGSTFENRENLPEIWFQNIIKVYEGTRKGRQELSGELLEDVLGALWSQADIDDHRMKVPASGLRRIVVAVDPQTNDPDAKTIGTEDDTAETGIVVCGVTDIGGVDHGFCLADRSLKAEPGTWARTALDAYHEFGADAIVVEVNQGGAMVAHTIRMALRPGEEMPRIIEVHAKRGKHTRAEPVATLASPGENKERTVRLHMVGTFPKLEEQLCTWVPGMKSPDRLDAYVYAFTDLFPNEWTGAMQGATATPRTDIASILLPQRSEVATPGASGYIARPIGGETLRW